MNLVARIRTTIAEQHLFSPGETVVVAVSGGPDSLALLHVLRMLRNDLAIRLHVAHLNHQLRGAESEADAAFVASMARDWSLDVTVETEDVAARAHEEHLALEEAARHARYDFLALVAGRVGARVIAVGHNADDQVETVLMHFLRGAGLAGLRGMQFNAPGPKRAGGSQGSLSEIQIVRPLLGTTRAEIEAYCQDNGLVPRLDHSNLDTTFFRNRLRHEVLPYLETLNPNLRQVLVHTALVLGDDYEFLQDQVRVAYEQVTTSQGMAIDFALEPWRGLAPALQRGTLRMAIQRLRSELRDVDWTHVENARRVALEKGVGARVTLPHGLQLVVDYERMTMADETYVPPLPDIPLLNVDRIMLPREGRVVLPDSDWAVETSSASHPSPGGDRWTVLLDADQVLEELALRCRRSGDRFKPTGLQGHDKSLHEFMIDGKLPRALRERLPLLVAGDRILWVCGQRVAEGAAATAMTQRFLRVSFRKQTTGR
jgi:tRNA(Ile)-lysidine synthase